MAEMFDSIVKTIANEYVNSILFVDEQAFSSRSASSIAIDKQKRLDASVVSQAFSNAGKICGFFAPKTIEDIETCKTLVLKPDIIVLDWDIQINKVISKEEESQDDETDDRGYYSIELIKAIAIDAKEDKLKVIFVYTGEPGLNDIVSSIVESLGDGFKVNNNQFEVSSGNIHILVRLKPDSKVPVDYNAFKVSYEDLPSVVIDSFSKYVSGLMPCYAMKSLIEIKNSSAKVLKVYNSELDAELLGHQMALPNPDDVKTYLANSFGSAITELILGSKEIDIDLWVEDWIDSKMSASRSLTIAGQEIVASATSVKTFFDNRYDIDNIKERFNTSFSAKCSSKNEKKLISSLSSVFQVEDVEVERAKFRFAALSHIKNLFSTAAYVPCLTLGSIVYKLDSEQLFLCIQQRCDTARVPINGQRFVFLPLYKEKQSNMFGAISVAPGVILYIKKSSSNAVSFWFRPDDDQKPVRAIMEDGKYVFKSSDGVFEWKNELKEIIAQKIVNAFSSHFARIGVDEAEWLRIEGSCSE